MNRNERIISLFIALCALCLVAVVLLKPKVDAEFHRQYSDNLNQLHTLIGELGRDHLQVQFGLVMHYDYIEADLQAMQQAIELSLLPPDFVSTDYLQQLKAHSDIFMTQLDSARKLVEATKRFVGLVRNSDRSLRTLFRQLRAQAKQRETLALLSQLQQGIANRESESATLALITSIERSGDIEGGLLVQLKAHVGIVSRYNPKLYAIGKQLKRELSQIETPQVLRSAYREEYAQQTAVTEHIALFSNVIGALLVTLCMLLVRFTLVAKRQTLEASERIEQQMDETHEAVNACNEVLTKIAHGDFRSRVQHSFGGDLALLCNGVNTTAGRVDEAMRQLAEVMGALEHGRFDARMDANTEGELRQQVEQAMTTLESTLNSIVSVMENMRQGSFTSRIDIDAKGDLGRLKDAVNASLDALETAIGEITSVMQSQSQGNLSHRIERELPGQLGSLSESINVTTTSLENIVHDISHTSDALANVGSQVQRQSKSLSEHSSAQVLALADTLSGTEDVTRSITASRDLTNMATQHASAAYQQALDGEAVAKQAVDSMERVLMSSKQIHDITDMINEIAFQTHLLSLNAAIEAARASRQGAGFGVVAQEVGSLARRCADSSAEIRGLVDKNLKQIQSGAERVRETGSALSNISSAVEKVSQIVVEINEHCVEQSNHIEHVNHSITKVDDLTQHNATLAESSLSSAQQLSEHARNMQKIVSVFAHG